MNKQADPAQHDPKPVRGAAQAAGIMPGFGNVFETEPCPGALASRHGTAAKMQLWPFMVNNFSGTLSPPPSHQNERTWCYVIRPSVKHTKQILPRSIFPTGKAPRLVDPECDQPRSISLGSGALPIPMKTSMVNGNAHQ